MSFLVTDVWYGDVLSENNIKPWWEKYRGYFLGGQVFSSLSLVYMIISGGLTVNCLPWGQNITEAAKFSNIQGAVVDAYCSNQILSYAPSIASSELILSIATLLIASYWLTLPAVVDAFRRFGEVGRIISNLDMTLRELREALVKPISKDSSDNELKLREAIMLLWKYGKRVELKSIYVRRSRILVCFLAMQAIATLVVSVFWLRTPDKYRCKVSTSDSSELLPGATDYICIGRNIGHNLAFYAILCCISQTGQVVLVINGLRVVARPTETQSKSTEAENNAFFMLLFWKYANTSRSGALKGFLKFAFSVKAQQQMTENLERAVAYGDSDFTFEYSKLSGGFKVVETLVQLLTKQGGELEDSENFLDILRETKFTFNESKEIAKAAAKMKRWKILSATLHYCTLSEKEKNQNTLKVQWINEMNLNLDELTYVPHVTGWKEMAGSLLFYAAREEPSQVCGEALSLKRLLYNFWDGRVKYVHFCGKSVTIKNFLERELPDQAANIIENYADVPDHSPFAVKSRSQSELHKLFCELKEVGDKPSTKYWEYLRTRIYRSKFSHWDEPAKEFAKYLNQRQLWEELVTLLNAFIVTEERRPLVGKLDCGVPSFENVDEIFPIALKTQPLGFEQGYFIPTAARHILACCSSDQRRSCLKYIHDPHYVINGENREQLLSFVWKCQQEEMTPARSWNDQTLQPFSLAETTSLSTPGGAIKPTSQNDSNSSNSSESTSSTSVIDGISTLISKNDGAPCTLSTIFPISSPTSADVGAPTPLAPSSEAATSLPAGANIYRSALDDDYLASHSFSSDASNSTSSLLSDISDRDGYRGKRTRVGHSKKN